MVSKCSNPNCLVTFRYLGKGAFFLFEVNSETRTFRWRRKYDDRAERAAQARDILFMRTLLIKHHARMIRSDVETGRRGVVASGTSRDSRSELTETADAKSGQISRTD